MSIVEKVQDYIASGDYTYLSEVAERFKLTNDEVQMIFEEMMKQDSYNDSMDGDFDSAMASAGYGTDEDYGYYGDE